MQQPRGRSSGSAAHPARHRRLPFILVAVGLVVVVLLGAGFIWWNQRGPSQPSIGGAVDRFRSSTHAPSDAAALQPPPGVYTYAGSGDEKLSFLATHQSEDGDLPGTVTRGADGCWTFAIDYNTFHRQSWSRCAEAGRLVEHGNVSEQKFDFGALSQSERTEVVCEPATILYDLAVAPGHREQVRCTGHSQTTNTNMTQRGQRTFIGRTTVVVGGTRVRALHYAQDVKVSGDQTGSAHEEVWIAAKNGLPLREERTISVVSPAPAPLNHVTYSEHGRWQLTSLTPQK